VSLEAEVISALLRTGTTVLGRFDPGYWVDVGTSRIICAPAAMWHWESSRRGTGA
jgi:hypothetical protein